MDILNSHDKEFLVVITGNVAECLVIGFCLYIALTFHIKNLTQLKTANELVTSVHSLNILHFNVLNQVVSYSWPARLVKPWVL